MEAKKITFIVKDRRIKNAVINKICKENNIDKNDICCNEHFNYMDYSNEISITLLSTIYKGIEYTFKYFDGCFNAYMVATVIDYNYIINQYNHYILIDKLNNDLYIKVGWTINNNPQNLYNCFLKSKNITNNN